VRSDETRPMATLIELVTVIAVVVFALLRSTP
jgi:hypothetical protein